ncbi:MAG TPA: cobalamin biosynthesis protein CobD, partial [Chloroflexi bacterium]|nr:cobalamin biosynthesis protein CobD [Chloroflexota bacterium]
MSDRAATLLLALLLDALAGDPPGVYHPVAWMGEAIGAAQRAVRRYAPEAGSG